MTWKLTYGGIMRRSSLWQGVKLQPGREGRLESAAARGEEEAFVPFGGIIILPAKRG